MSTVTVTLTKTCSGGGHLTVVLTGDVSITRVIELRELTEPVDERDLIAFLGVLAKLARMGRTNTQARTLLQNGVTLAI